MPRTGQQRIAIIIPAFNEGQIIGEVVSQLQKVLSSGPDRYQVIVIDDGSLDDTAQQAEAAGAVVIRHLLNSGSGHATATGLEYVRQHGFNLAATMDADGQHDPQDTLKGIELAKAGEADLMIGSRLIDSQGMSTVKVVGNRSLSFFTAMMFGVEVGDSQSGLRIFSPRALERIYWRSGGFEYCSEMIWRAKQLGLTIKEYPIKAIYTDYSMSKGQNNWNGVNIVRSLVRQRVVELFGE